MGVIMDSLQHPANGTIQMQGVDPASIVEDGIQLLECGLHHSLSHIF